MIGYSGTKKKSFSSSVQFHCENGNTKALQMFAKSPQRWAHANISDKDAAATTLYITTNNVFLVIHGSYLINMANPSEKSINCAVDDLLQASRLSAVGAIFHMGRACGAAKNVCYENMANFIVKVVDSAPDNVQFILETSSGEGSETCSDIHDLAEFYYYLISKLPTEKKNMIRFCIDTAHIYAAGYNISTTAGAQSFIDLWKELLDWKLVSVVHLNDSKQCCHSCIDSHQDIGKGEITANGVEGLRHMVRFFAENNIPMILETPCGTLDKPAEIKMVKKWIK